MTSEANFRPHAVILTERSIPDQIWLAAVLGVERLLRVDLHDPEESYVEQTQTAIQQRIARWGGRKLPAFGAPTGFVINYATNWAVEFDLAGKVIATMSHVRRLGHAEIHL